jgi:hypothetical protein
MSRSEFPITIDNASLPTKYGATLTTTRLERLTTYTTQFFTKPVKFKSFEFSSTYPFPEKSKRKELIPSFSNATARLTIIVSSRKLRDISCQHCPK